MENGKIYIFFVPEITNTFFSPKLQKELGDYYIFHLGSQWAAQHYLARSSKTSDRGRFTQRDAFPFSICSTSICSSFSVLRLRAIVCESDLNTAIFLPAAAGSHARLRDLYWGLMISYSFNTVQSPSEWWWAHIISHISYSNYIAAHHAFCIRGPLCPRTVSYPSLSVVLVKETPRCLLFFPLVNEPKELHLLKGRNYLWNYKLQSHITLPKATSLSFGSEPHWRVIPLLCCLP